jgi:Excreted virulence factor EspC, type VII ESX diderm
MGEPDAARVDMGVLLDVAGGYDASSEVLDDVVRTHLARWAFGGAVAGRAHAAHGEALRTAVDALAGNLDTWVRSGAEIASAMRVSVDRYLAAEARGTVRLG